ncbi:MAG: outer membrane protein transport protein, partial [Pseudomonadales bacterium]|nr:outer membrane protein transport protein [Pseudomonadales bacterium]
AGDTIKDQASLSPAARMQFDDILVPRIGGEYRLNDNFMFLTGVAYRESPLKTTRNREVNYLDTDKISIGLGLSATYNRTRFLAYPVRVDLGYQYQMLQKRDFTIVDFNGNEEDVTADGDIHVFSGSVTLKF